MSDAPADFVSLHQPVDATKASFKSTHSLARLENKPIQILKEQLDELMRIFPSYIYIYIYMLFSMNILNKVVKHARTGCRNILQQH